MNKNILRLSRIVRRILYKMSSEGRQLSKILQIERHTIFQTKIFGKLFKGIDSASFVGQYTEILKKEIYSFNTNVPSPYIIDCGANVGVSVLFFKTKYPNAEVIAFEPDKFVYSVLQENVKNFSFQNVTLFNSGVWKSEGKINFLSKGDDSGKILKEKNPLDDTTEIEVVRLRTYLNRPVQLLKIDIEGAEYEVLQDISDLLVNVERIFIEYHSFVNEKQNLHLILSLLDKAGFRYYLDQAVIFSANPFLKISTMNGLDNLINIFGYRLNDSK